jgi:HPt (histidine-containing phosphotransfer) domain-containing protein
MRARDFFQTSYSEDQMPQGDAEMSSNEVPLITQDILASKLSPSPSPPFKKWRRNDSFTSATSSRPAHTTKQASAAVGKPPTNKPAAGLELAALQETAQKMQPAITPLSNKLFSSQKTLPKNQAAARDGRGRSKDKENRKPKGTAKKPPR